jgi:hypothetical protein
VQRSHVIAALASAILLVSANTSATSAAPTLTTAGPAIATPSPGLSSAPPVLMTAAPVVPTAAMAIDGRYLVARRTTAGYTLGGQALTKDACQAARFDRIVGNIFPPAFMLGQFRRPGTMGLMCIQRLTWVTASPLAVASKYPPKWVTVRTQKRAIRVPVK